MNKYFAYTRVSTVKQGEGVSLEAQRDAIAAYVTKHDLIVSQWYEEKETAAKRGRPLFSAMLKALQAGQADGLVIHKIDRSARNPYDWAAISELLDRGIDVRFVHESLDLTSRGGRITADIQAVIAADYVRNLREECIKGINGRLKQGLYPFKAPIGYLDQGPGKPKIPDPERAPFVRQAFELYATQKFSFRSLLVELNRRGFRNSAGKPITKGCFENLLNNPFYHGEILLKQRQQSYRGIHEPIIDKALFDRVKELKSDKQNKKSTTHDHLYRRLITCGGCGRSLYGERQKAHVYMRCQTVGCPTTSIREDRIDAEIGTTLQSLEMNVADQKRLEAGMRRWLRKRNRNNDRQAIKLQLSNLDQRQAKLTDALVDGLIDKPDFLLRKERLDADRTNLERSLQNLGQIDDDARLVRNFLELAKNVYLTYHMADFWKRRRMAEILFSNRTLTEKNLCLEPQKWLQDKAWTIGVLLGPPDQDRTRTKEEVTRVIKELTTKDDVA